MFVTNIGVAAMMISKKALPATSKPGYALNPNVEVPIREVHFNLASLPHCTFSKVMIFVNFNTFE